MDGPDRPSNGAVRAPAAGSAAPAGASSACMRIMRTTSPAAMIRWVVGCRCTSATRNEMVKPRGPQDATGRGRAHGATPMIDRSDVADRREVLERSGEGRS